MESYLAAPTIHANAVKNPKMLGGPFIDYQGGRVDEIMALMERTKRDRALQIEFSAALTALDHKLLSQADGFSLESLYRDVPELLAGYVELCYDLNNHPSFRLLEPLLYKSKLYELRAQSLMLSELQTDSRPFILSTSRLDGDNSLNLRIPFHSPVIDQLFRLKTTPSPYAAIGDLLQIEADGSVLKSMLSPLPPPAYQAYAGSGVRWRYFGHACILTESKDLSILVDPVLSYTYESDISRYTYLDLPDTIDYVLITHNHQDHVLLKTLLQIRHKTKHIVVPASGMGPLQDPSLRLALEAIGFTNVIELGDLDNIPIPGGCLTALPFLGEHCDLSIRCKAAYHVRIGKHSLLFAADSCNVEPKLYEHLHKEVGAVEVVFIGMECDGAPLTWIYGPLLTKRLPRDMDNSRRLAGSNYEQAIEIVNQFQCRHVYVYAMGQEPWLNYIMSLRYDEHSRPIVESNRLVEECRERGLIAERLFGEKEILLD